VALAMGGGAAGVAVGTVADVALVGAGGAYIYSMLQETADNSASPSHAPAPDDEAYPLPEYLRAVSYDHTVNVGVFGASGAGKSTLINTLRELRPGSVGAAPVGANETTMVPTMYTFPDLSAARLWDMPGAGTERFPRDTYIRDMGLRFFDAAMLVSTTRVTETDLQILTNLQRFGVPCFVVRSKIDVDIRNELEDNEQPAELTRSRIHDELKRNLPGVIDVFLVSKLVHDHDLPRLRQNLLASVLVNRRENVESDCPVCFQPFTIVSVREPLSCQACQNRVCRSCVEQMRNPLGGCFCCPSCRGPFWR